MSEPKEACYVAISPVAGVRFRLDKDFLGDKRIEDVIEILRSWDWQVVKATQEDTDAK